MDIFKEEKFEKGGVILERIHPDLQVEPYVPYYEKMGYVVSIVEKPNGWVELIGEKKDTFEDAYGRFKDDIRENFTPRKMAKGGKVGKGYKVFNYTDNIYASDETFTSVANAKKFIKDFRKRFEAQGYYRDNRQNKISPNHIDLEVIKSSFNPYGFAKGGKFLDKNYIIRGAKIFYWENDTDELNRKIYRELPPMTISEAINVTKKFFENNKVDTVELKYDWGDTENLLFRIDKKNKNGKLETEAKLMIKEEFNYARGGRTKIENDGVDFNEEMYRGILGDRDKDGTENADDVAPNNPEIADYIEKDTPFSKTFRTLLDDKRMYDDSMYSIIGEMEKILPQKFDIIARTKTPFSILKKLVGKKLKFKRDEYGKITNKGLTDVIGTTIATNNTNELMTVRGMIGIDEGDNGIFGEVIEVDDKYKIPLCGYRAIHYIVLYNGVPVEIQLKTKRMKMLNEFAHPFYKAEDLDCDGMGDLTEIVVMADNGSKEAQKEFADIFADKDRMRSIISKSYARGGEVEWFDYSKIDLEELPYDLDRYFIKDADTKEIDLKLLEPTRAREKGVKNANKYMRMAYDGEIDRRKPISVYERNGKMYVFDGNSTIANAKNSGWKTIYVEMIDDPNDDFERGGEVYDETKYNANEEIISTKKTNISNIDTRLKPFLKDKERFKVEIKRDKEFNIVKVEVYQKNFNKWRLFKTYINKKEFAKGGEITTWNWGGEPMLAFTKVDYDVNVNPSNLEVDVNIKESDSVDHYALNDTDAEWTQYRWGYMVYPKNEKQLYDVLKALRVSVSKQRLSDWFKSGGKSYAKGGRTKDAETLREMSSALKKGSGMHKKQSEQLMGASSSHKKQAKDLDRIADKISKGYARGGQLGYLFDYEIFDADGESIDKGSSKGFGKTLIEAKNNLLSRLQEGLNEGEEAEVYPSKFFARGGEISLSEREKIPTMIHYSSMSEDELDDSTFVQLYLSDRWITKNEFNRLKKILKKYDANGYFSSVKDKNDKRFLREDIDVNILGYKNLDNFLREIGNNFDFEVKIVKVALDEDEDGLSEDGEVNLDYFEQSSTQTNKFRDTKGNYKDVVNTDSDELVDEEEDLNWNFIKFAESPEFVYYVNDYELEADFDDVDEDDTFEYMAIHKPSKRGGVWEGTYEIDFKPLQMEYKANALTFKHPRLDESLKKFSSNDLLF